MRSYRLYITFLCCCLATGTQACHNARSPQGAEAVPAKADTTGTAAGATTVPPASAPSATVQTPAAGRQLAAAALAVKQSSADPEEQAFRRFFAVFQKAVQQDKPGQLEALLYFPLQTAQQWTNEDLKNMDVDKESGKVSRGEFNSYRKNIFTPDVIRLLPKAKEEELSEIDAQSPEDYYRVLRKCTDKATKMYEVYMQYPEKNGTAESYFAFVFGRVDGQYKVIGYYAKWPAKG